MHGKIERRTGRQQKQQRRQEHRGNLFDHRHLHLANYLHRDLRVRERVYESAGTYAHGVKGHLPRAIYVHVDMPKHRCEN